MFYVCIFIYNTIRLMWLYRNAEQQQPLICNKIALSRRYEHQLTKSTDTQHSHM